VSILRKLARTGRTRTAEWASRLRGFGFEHFAKFGDGSPDNAISGKRIPQHVLDTLLDGNRMPRAYFAGAEGSSWLEPRRAESLGKGSPQR